MKGTYNLFSYYISLLTFKHTWEVTDLIMYPVLLVYPISNTLPCPNISFTPLHASFIALSLIQRPVFSSITITSWLLAVPVSSYVRLCICLPGCFRIFPPVYSWRKRTLDSTSLLLFALERLQLFSFWNHYKYRLIRKRQLYSADVVFVYKTSLTLKTSLKCIVWFRLQSQQTNTYLWLRTSQKHMINFHATWHVYHLSHIHSFIYCRRFLLTSKKQSAPT